MGKSLIEAQGEWPGRNIHNYRLHWTDTDTFKGGRTTVYGPSMAEVRVYYEDEYPNRRVSEIERQW